VLDAKDAAAANELSFRSLQERPGHA
jgi:hypothetical protein